MQSDSIAELTTALIAAQSEFAPLTKSAINPHFKNKFVPLAEVVRDTLPVLNAHGLAITQFPAVVDGEPGLKTMLAHKSGQFKEEVMPLSAAKADPQGQGSAITYARRYAWMAALGLVGDEDDDGNAASKPRKVTSERVKANPTAADPLEGVLADAKARLRAAIRASGADGSDYAWVRDATVQDVDRISEAAVQLELTK